MTFVFDDTQKQLCSQSHSSLARAVLGKMNHSEHEPAHEHIHTLSAAETSTTNEHHTMAMMMNHAMTFHFGDDEVILFKFWTIHSAEMMVLSCLIVVVLCLTMEAVRWFRSFRKAAKKRILSASQQPSFCRPHITRALCLDTVLHAIQLTISYILMLLFMTFNVWICIAVVFGEVIGRFIFAAFFPSPELSSDQAQSVEHCCG
ncbi:High affinity copper uptake protein 1 [Toxocara canis]|uniref:Copper transport protein n=1 Tax=Toxocara canis TaxID=6265 RepID=A0A0B2VVI7_TOXCA|nr:High affinity copper uptake protein 1 [Toxocara canis]